MDWQHGAEHMWDRHQVTVEQAGEALADDEHIVTGSRGPGRRVVGCERVARQQHRKTYVWGTE